MVSINDALEIIYSNIKKKSRHIIPIEESIGSIVSQEYKASFDLPRFDNSAMDGYAVKVSDSGKRVKIKEITYAGDQAQEAFSQGEVVKIMTGAPTPNGCEAIVPIEDVEVHKECITLPPNNQKNKEKDTELNPTRAK
jgi:molybdopterin molybdotransferase